MEVTTVSPSPASPTEGNDLCEIDVTNVAVDSVTLLINLCGLVGNGTVVCLPSMGRRRTGVYGLALVDILFLLLTVPAALLFLVEDVSCSPIMPLLYSSVLFSLSVVSCHLPLFGLMLRSNIVYMDKLYKLCCCCDLPKSLLRVVYNVQNFSFFVLFTFIPAMTNLCPSHQQEHCWAALISMYIIILLFFAAPTVISSTINFISARWGSNKQQPKRHDIVVFLLVLFILLLSPCNFLRQLGYTVVSTNVLFLLNCTHSSIKPFIYFWAGGLQRPCSLRSLRLSLQRVFDEQKEETAPSNDALMDTRL